MLIIENDVIHITKGDDAAINVDVTVGGESYALAEGDILTLTVREMPDKAAPVLLEINSLPGSNRIVIDDGATAALEPGKYSADIQLTTAEKRIYTVWPLLEGSARYKVKNWGNFIIMPEVTARWET